MKDTFLYIFLIFTTIFSSCVEPYKLTTNTYEEALVIESTITDELKHQEVKLSVVGRLEQEEPITVNNAQVWVEDTNQINYSFSETESGKYISDEKFKVIPNVEYKLFITTEKGRKYESRGEYLTPTAPINKIYGNLETIDGKQGIQVYIDSNEDTGLAKFFRYEYVETFKITAAYSLEKEMFLEDIINTQYQLSYNINIVSIPDTNPVCYPSASQERIIQTSVVGSSENNIKKFPLRFLANDDFRIKEKYSIQVKQYTQTYDSYNFYKTISELGNVQSLLEQTQPGFVMGNVSSLSDVNEKVVGFFEVASVSSKRLFFYYKDFNFDIPESPYSTCELHFLDYNDNLDFVQDGDINEREKIFNIVVNNDPAWVYLQTDIMTGIHLFVTPWCSDCTTFSDTSTNLKPEFWED